MSDQQTFNPQNRYCIPGKEGCPACVSSLRHSGHRESFVQPLEELTPLAKPEAEALGLCLVAGTADIIGLGDSCRVSNTVFEKFTENIERLTLSSDLDQLPGNYHG